MNKIYIKALAVKTEKGTYRVVASTNAIDRQGDIVDQNGWELDNFLKNPVVLWAHKYDELPVGKALSIGKGKQGLEMEFEFTPAEANPKGEQVRQCFEGGYLNAVSVGFIPKERNGQIITRAELLEVSIVPVPANQEALRLAMSKGLDIKAIEADIEKGEVQNILTAEEIMQQKYENLDQVWSIVSALCRAYMTEGVAVEDFSKLLLETIGLLTKVANGEEVVQDTPAEDPIMDAYVAKKFTLKDGRVLSKKNRDLIGNCLTTMKGSIAVLEDLHKATDSSAEGDGKMVEPVVEEGITLSADELATLIRQQVRVIDKSSEISLGLINKFLTSGNK